MRINKHMSFDLHRKMKHNSLLLLLLAFLSALNSCQRIKNKGEELADTSVALGKELADTAAVRGPQYAKAAVNEVVPMFDAYTPDTKYNTERYTDFILDTLTPDVKNIYCFGDQIGIDANYQFAFTCNAATAQKIIAAHELKPDTANEFTGFRTDFKWWDATKIEKLDCYTHEGEHRIFTHFWYDEAEQKGYFTTYDM